jgi:hypothetical protein
MPFFFLKPGMPYSLSLSLSLSLLYLPSDMETEFKMDLMEAYQRSRKYMRLQSMVLVMRRYLLLLFFVEPLLFVVGIYR